MSGGFLLNIYFRVTQELTANQELQDLRYDWPAVHVGRYILYTKILRHKVIYQTQKTVFDHIPKH